MSRSGDPRDPELSRLYRDAAGAEPPAALDASILAAARAEAARRPVRRSWWRKILIPVSVAATAVFAVALTLTVEREQSGRGEAAPAHAPALQREADVAAPPPAPKLSEPGPEARPARDAGLPRERSRATQAAPRSASEVPHAPASTPLQERATAPAASAPVPFEAPGQVGKAENAPAAAGAAADGIAAERAASPAPAQVLRKAVPAAEVRRDPLQWLEEIRALKRVGRESEATAALAAFRRAYPDYALPEDLK